MTDDGVSYLVRIPDREIRVISGDIQAIAGGYPNSNWAISHVI